MGEKKGDIDTDMIGWMVLGAIVLIIVVGGYFILKAKGIGAIEFIKNLFRLRGS